MDKEGHGADFFKQLKAGAIFRWMELGAAGASQERLDAQMRFAQLLELTARQVEDIDAMDAAENPNG